MSSVYLVCLEGNDFSHVKYDQKYKVFSRRDDAVAWAESNGFESLLGVNDALGFLNYWACGDSRISIIHLSVLDTYRD